MNWACAEIVGNVWKIEVAEGDDVAAGDVVAILETMKMEIPVTAPVGGTVGTIAVEVGQIVQEGEQLVQVVPTA